MEHHDDGMAEIGLVGTAMTDPVLIEKFRIVCLHHALRDEILTGMRRSSRGRATSTIVREALKQYGSQLVADGNLHGYMYCVELPRSKADLLRRLEGMMRERGLSDYIRGTEEIGQ